MKTNVFILALLAISVLGTAQGQTPANQAFQANKHYVLGYAHYTDAERREFSRIEDPTELTLRADDLSRRAVQTHQLSLRRNGEERDRLVREVAELQQKAAVYQLAAAELAAFNTREEFNMSRASFKALLEASKQNQVITIKAATLYAAAVKSYRMATEMREEAYALPSINATLGNLHNAEEKEFFAMIKINEAIQVLRESPAPALATR